MDTGICGMPSERVRQHFENVDGKLASKLEEVIRGTLKEIQEDHRLRAKGNPYSEARAISERAYGVLKGWAQENFTTSPEKELAAAWINGCARRFFGPNSIQKDIRQILSGEE